MKERMEGDGEGVPLWVVRRTWTAGLSRLSSLWAVLM
jgi:hypothetical protein